MFKKLFWGVIIAFLVLILYNFVAGSVVSLIGVLCVFFILQIIYNMILYDCSFIQAWNYLKEKLK